MPPWLERLPWLFHHLIMAVEVSIVVYIVHLIRPSLLDPWTTLVLVVGPPTLVILGHVIARIRYGVWF